MKTKDVRHLCLCPVCGKLGDERLMLRAGLTECLAHDRCVFSTDNAVAAAAIKVRKSSIGPHNAVSCPCGDIWRRLDELADWLWWLSLGAVVAIWPVGRPSQHQLPSSWPLQPVRLSSMESFDCF